MDIRIGGIVFSDWKIVREIGRGASGIVYEILKEDQGASLTAALKVLQIQGEPEDNSEGVVDRLHKLVDELVGEIKIMISLKEFAYVVKCEDFAVESSPAGDQWTIAIRMEMLESLAGYRCRHEMTEADIHRLALHITKALVLMEERGIIHRDIKPENIFVSRFGDFKLGDFGIARVCGQTMASRSQEGTQIYMAPEVFRCQEFDHTADIYSLGLVLYRHLNKDRLPFLPAEGAISPIDRQSALAERLSGKKEISAPVCASEEFGRIILKMCAYRPEDRYANAAVLLRDLEAIRPAKRVVLPAGGPGTETLALQDAEEGLTGGHVSSLRGHSGKAGVVGDAAVRDPVGNEAYKAPATSGVAGSYDRAEKRQDKDAGDASAAHTRKERGYKPPVGADTGSGGKKQKPVGKKKLLLTIALVTIVLVSAIPAIISRGFALLGKDGSGNGSYKAGQVDDAAEQTVGTTHVSATYGDGRNMGGSIAVSQGAQRPDEIPEAADVILLDIDWTGKKEMSEQLYITVSDPSFPDGDGLAVYHCESDGQWNLIGTYVIRDHAVTFPAESLSPFAFQVIGSEPEVSPTPVPTAIPSPAPIYEEVVEQDGMPAVQLPDDNVLARQLLTEQDRQQAAVGAPVSIRLDVLDANKTVAQAEKALVDGALKDLSDVGAVGQYMDLRLSKIVNGLQTPLTGPLAQELLLVIDVPDALRADGRTFVAVRIHEGVAAVLRDQDKDPNTITILTDQFSIYALAYTEPAPPSPTPLWVQVPIPAPAATAAPSVPTPEPSTEGTPEPGSEVTPEPSLEVTPEPGTEVTPEPGSEVTPEPDTDIPPEPALGMGADQSASSETGGEV